MRTISADFAYLLKKVNVPVYGTKLTLGLVDGKLKEHGLSGKVKLIVTAPRKTVKMGCMAVEFIKVNHSIPDSCRNGYTHARRSYRPDRRFQSGL